MYALVYGRNVHHAHGKPTPGSICDTSQLFFCSFMATTLSFLVCLLGKAAVQDVRPKIATGVAVDMAPRNK